jgi:hypothetical protein
MLPAIEQTNSFVILYLFHLPSEKCVSVAVSIDLFRSLKNAASPVT